MVTHKIWLIRPDAETVSALTRTLPSHEFVIEQIPEIPLGLAANPKPSVIVLSVMDTGMPALNVLVSAQKVAPAIPVIVLVRSDQARIAVEALKLGAADALVAPVDAATLVSGIRSALAIETSPHVKANPPEYPQLSADEGAVFISSSKKMLEIWNVATTVARTNVPVLILGESGVGKEVVARFIHRHSRRADKPLVKVNCAALPHDLLESELFGYERGAFTGAVGEKPGKFELADKGCILLDEIGEMPPSLQAKLLHVLEGGEFSRLGAKRSIKVDVRVLASTNRKLHEAIPRGEFRDDLYFRLSVVKISIPPLRERKDDIPLLCEHFMKRHRDDLSSSGEEEIPPELLHAFMSYHWPGNVRQLENLIRRHLILPDLDMELGATDSTPSVPNDLLKYQAAAAAATGTDTRESHVLQFPTPNESVSLKQVASIAADRVERELVLHVLGQTNWNRSHAARRLNICYRALLNKLKKWQINQPRAS